MKAILFLTGLAFALTKTSFALIGDLPYSKDAITKLDRILESINKDPSIAFTLHTGDIKSGSIPCDDKVYHDRFTQLQQLKKPMIFTPGDNEWTDCHREAAGRYNPIERLNFLRNVFYSKKLQLPGYQRQSDVMSKHKKFVENAMFTMNGNVFASVHVVGSINNLKPWDGIDPKDTEKTPRKERIYEFETRQVANIAWLDHIFQKAKQQKSDSVFIVIQADVRFHLPREDPQRKGFNKFIDELERHTKEFGKRVVLLNGDEHLFKVDKPFNELSNFTRIQGFGEDNLFWVKVQVEGSVVTVSEQLMQ